MSTSNVLASTLLWLSAACAAIEDGTVAALPAAAPRPAEAREPEHAAASQAVSAQPSGLAVAAPAAATAGTAPADAASAGEVELAVWRDPVFQKRFAESYAAETDIEPRVTATERDSMQQVLELIATEKHDKALALLEKMRGDAASAVVDFMFANIHYQAERLDEAAAAYQVAVEKFPKFRRAWRNLALIHVRRGEFVRALPALTRVVELGGGDSLTYGLLGFAHSSCENELSAESAYRMAILLDPSTIDWKMGLARSFFRQARYADAVALCGALIEADPDRADLWLLQANAYVGLGEPERAAENYEIVDRLGRSTPESLTMLADIYVNSGLHDLAVGGYVRALEKDPDGNPERAVRAAKALAARSALAEASRLIAAIEAVHGERLSAADRKDLLKLRARIAVAQGAGGEEARVLEEIVALDPLDGEALILLGQHASRTGEPERAAFWYERAASLEAFEADAKVRHAQLLVGLGRYAEALPLLRRAQSIQPRENIQEYLVQVERVAQAR